MPTMATISKRRQAWLPISHIGSALLAFGLVAGCVSHPTGTGKPTAANPSPWASPTSTLRWNEYAAELVSRNQSGQIGASRTFAYLNLAMHNAIVGAKAQGRPPEGAAAGAAATVLAFAFAKDEAAIQNRLALEMASLGAGARPRFAAGVESGRAAANDVIAGAKADRIAQPWTGSLPSGAGKWVSQTQPPAAPLAPGLGQMRTFFMTSGAEFRPAGPPAADSPRFLAAVAEIRSISDSRTNEQLRIAQYWESIFGAFAAGLWNEQARAAISARGLDEATSAHHLAVLHMAVMDALIACHDAKYVYWVPRPRQMDPAIVMTIGMPNHPSYPSNGAAINTVAGAILDAQFPEQGGRFSAMARQGSDSRYYAGIHYRFDVEDAVSLGQKIATRALQGGVPADRAFAPSGK